MCFSDRHHRDRKMKSWVWDLVRSPVHREWCHSWQYQPGCDGPPPLLLMVHHCPPEIFKDGGKDDDSEDNIMIFHSRCKSFDCSAHQHTKSPWDGLGHLIRTQWGRIIWPPPKTLPRYLGWPRHLEASTIGIWIVDTDYFNKWDLKIDYFDYVLDLLHRLLEASCQVPNSQEGGGLTWRH